LQIIKENKNGVTLLKFYGEMTENNIGYFKKAIKELQNIKENTVILDLEKITMIDSSGIGAICFLYKRYHSSEKNIIITSLKEPFARLFKMVKFDKIFEIYPSVEEALKTFNSMAGKLKPNYVARWQKGFEDSISI
jgi:anti-sigma B factor antagonist